jgi:CRISPR system Cascade subunit CasA
MPESPQLVLYNLLEDPLLGVEDDNGRRDKVTLPGLLVRLSNGESTVLTGVQAHQQHAVHAFLVQLAALALARAGTEDLAHDEGSWRELVLRAAADDGGGAEAFSLVVSDLAKPAFLQPPIPEGTLAALGNEHSRPSAELDVLITAKNHDVKVDRIEQPSVEDWFFALLTLQTMQGFLGAGNYGIARMNGGFASRPCVAFAQDQRSASRFVRDLCALLGARAALGTRFGSTAHIGLVWCVPWGDGSAPLSMSDLDPFFIEVCRRIRLTVALDGSLVAHRGSTKVARIDAKLLNGNTGDPWTPVARKDGRALTMAEGGFGYDRVQDLMFGDWRPGASGEAREDASDRLWVGQVLVRGQGKTGGYHERWVPIPSKSRRLFTRSEERTRVGEVSRRWVGYASEAWRKVLKPALLTLLQGGPEKLKFDDDRSDSFRRGFDASIDDDFFPLLFRHSDDSPEEADAVFQANLVKRAKAQLDRALESVPVPSARRWRAEAFAYRVFFGAAHKHLKLAFPTSHVDSTEVHANQGDTP